MTAFAGLAFATAVRVVDRVHRHAANGRANAHPALDAGLAQLAQAVLFVGDLADALRGSRCGSCELHRSACAPGRKCLHGPAGWPRCPPSARSARPCPACSSTQWMIEPTGMLRIGSVLPARIGASEPLMHGSADFQATGRNDVAALAVGVAAPGRCAPMRFGSYSMRSTLAGIAVLVATEVDHAVVVLVTAALVAGGDVAVVVTTGLLELRFQQSGMGRTLVQVVTRDLHHATPAGRSWFRL